MSTTPRERVLAALRMQPVDRIPWVPFVGCHAASLIDKSAGEYLKSEELMVQGVQAAIDRYTPDGIPVIFDLQLEAEALGCELAWADGNPPAVASHPLAEGVALEDIPRLDTQAGRIGKVLRATSALREANPDIALYGLITGPFTLALHLLGTNIFMDMFDNPEKIHALLDFCGEVGVTMAKAFMDTGCDVVAVVDPMTSQIGPDQLREFVNPYAIRVFDSIRTAGSLSSFFVCGHAQQNIEAMCDCGPDNISVDENIPLDYVRDICLPRKVSFGGNMQLTSVLLLGSELDSQKSALECLETGGKTGFLLAPGCDLPYDTPPENIEAVGKLASDPYQQEVVCKLTDEDADGDNLDMSDYGSCDQVIVDVITLDSEACAPCQYMVEAVRAVAPEFEGIVKWREHKIKFRESLEFMTGLMVKNIPTICIDGAITFISRIPRREEMIAAIQRRIIEKLRKKIQRRQAVVFLLGDEKDEQTITAKENIERAARELGSEVEIQVTGNEDKFYLYGLTPAQAPAVVVARYNVKSVRTAPEVAVVKEWIKDLGV
jgi:MtaA/CmuA family methyltransferase